MIFLFHRTISSCLEAEKSVDQDFQCKWSEIHFPRKKKCLKDFKDLLADVPAVFFSKRFDEKLQI